MSKEKILSELTGIPAYRIKVDDRGEYITKAGALIAMDKHAETEVVGFFEWQYDKDLHRHRDGYYFFEDFTDVDSKHFKKFYTPKELYDIYNEKH